MLVNATAGIGDAHFFITSTLTFCMSTFWLNSTGNFVDFKILASTEVAMLSSLCGHACHAQRRCRVRESWRLRTMEVLFYNILSG